MEINWESRIRDLLSNADLQVVTAKKIRKQLESETGVDLSDQKKQIDAITLRIVEDIMSARDAVATAAEKKKPAAELKKPVQDKRLKSPRSASPTVTKRQTASSSAASRPAASKRSKISDEVVLDSSDEDAAELDDHQLALQLDREQNNRRSTRNQGLTSRRTAVKPVQKRKATGGFMMPVRLSEELSVICGTNELSRGQVVKKVWDYIKEKNLQDPSDRRYILPDDHLKAVFPKTSISSFEMSKYLAPHMTTIPKEERQSVREPQAEEEHETKRKKAPRANSVFMRPWLLSPALSDVLGVQEVCLKPDDNVKNSWNETARSTDGSQTHVGVHQEEGPAGSKRQAVYSV